MQQNLNKLKDKKARIVLNEKFSFNDTGLSKKIFMKSLIKEYVKQNGDTFFHEGVPVSINIEIRTTSKASSEERANRFTTHMPNLVKVVPIILEAMNGAVYTKVTQVAELFITKLYSNENRIVIEVERI